MSEERVVFTKEMAKDYTILIPMMCPIHFTIMKNVFVNSRYKVELLENCGLSVVEEGLKYVHNDTCYPALLVIGQMIDALKSGKYDTHKTALIITQTGGGCRASNYIFLLRKALKKAELDYVPVISLNFSGLESQPGFKLTIPILRRMLAAMYYGDMLMDLSNQVKAYEVCSGEAMKLVDEWIEKLSEQFKHNHGYKKKEMLKNMNEIVRSFDKIERVKQEKVKVGIVGEIYIKYSSLGNNNLEDFLASQDCEVKVPGIMGFMMYCVYNAIVDDKLYGAKKSVTLLYKLVYQYLLKTEKQVYDCIAKNSSFDVPGTFDKLVEKAEKVIGLGTKMGEGWLLTGEMMELSEAGFKNIISTQPFGCLPNHIVAKGMARKIRAIDPDCNIVAIDYDPSATSVNQENRIKLMLAIAKEKLNENKMMA